MGGLFSKPKAHTVDTLYPKSDEQTELENRMHGIAMGALNAYQAPLSGMERAVASNGKGTGNKGYVERAFSAPSPYLERDAAGNVRSYVPSVQRPEDMSLVEALMALDQPAVPWWDPSAFFAKKEDAKEEQTANNTKTAAAGDNRAHKGRDDRQAAAAEKAKNAAKDKEHSNRMTF
jgi:hypothetical protein